MTTFNRDTCVAHYLEGIKAAGIAQEEIQKGARLSVAGLVNPETMDDALADLNEAIKAVAFKAAPYANKLAAWFQDNTTIGFNKKTIEFYIVDDVCELTDWHDLSVLFWKPRPKAGDNATPNDVDAVELANKMLKQLQATVGKDAKRKSKHSKAKTARMIQAVEALQIELAGIIAPVKAAAPTEQQADNVTDISNAA